MIQLERTTMARFARIPGNTAHLPQTAVASLLADDFRFKYSQYLPIVTEHYWDWEHAPNNKLKGEVRNTMITSLIRTEIKGNVKSYDTPVAARINNILNTLFKGLKQLRITTNTIFVGRRYTKDVYGTFIGDFKILVSREEADICRFFIKLALATPRVIEHSGFGEKIFKTFATIPSTIINAPATAKAAIDHLTETFMSFTDLITGWSATGLRANAFFARANALITDSIAFVHNTLTDMACFLMPCLRVLYAFIVSPESWRPHVLLAISEILLNKPHLITRVQEMINNTTPIKVHQHSGEPTSTSSESTPLKLSGVCEAIDSYMQFGPGLFYNALVCLLGSIFMLCPETKPKQKMKKNGQKETEEEAELNMLDKFYALMSKTESGFSNIEKSSSRADKLVNNFNNLTEKIMSLSSSQALIDEKTTHIIEAEEWLKMTREMRKQDIIPILKGVAIPDSALSKRLREWKTKTEGRKGVDGSLQTMLADKVEHMTAVGWKINRKLCETSPKSPMKDEMKDALSWLQKVQEENANKYVVAGTRVRSPPIFLVLRGEPGRGKTIAMNYIHRAWFYIRGYFSPQDQNYSMENQVYYYDGGKYWNGYKNQLITAMDDIGQKVSSADNPDELYELIIKLCNSAPYNLSMAHLSDKGTCFSSEFITSTTNIKLTGDARAGGVNDKTAFQRRITMELEVTVDKKYMKTLGRNAKGKLTQVVDSEKVLAEFGVLRTPEIWNFHFCDSSDENKKWVSNVRFGGQDFHVAGGVKLNKLIHILAAERNKRLEEFNIDSRSGTDLLDYFEQDESIPCADPEHFKNREDVEYEYDEEQRDEDADIFYDLPDDEGKVKEHSGVYDLSAGKFPTSEPKLELCPHGNLCSQRLQALNPCKKYHSEHVVMACHSAWARAGQYTVEKIGNLRNIIWPKLDETPPVENLEYNLDGDQISWTTPLIDIAQNTYSYASSGFQRLRKQASGLSDELIRAFKEHSAKAIKHLNEVSSSVLAKWMSISALLCGALYGMYKLWNTVFKKEDDAEKKPVKTKPLKNFDSLFDMEESSFADGVINHSQRATMNRKNRSSRRDIMSENIDSSLVRDDEQWAPARNRICKIANNTYEIVCCKPQDYSVNGVCSNEYRVGVITMVQGRIGLTARHVIDGMRERYQEGYTMLLRNQSCKSGVRLDADDFEVFLLDAGDPVDMSAVVIKRGIMREAASLMSMFERTPESMGYGGRAPAKAFRFYPHDERIRVSFTEIMPVSEPIEAYGGKPGIMTVDHFFLSAGGIPGHSGGCVFMIGANGNGAFVGLYRGVGRQRALGARLPSDILLKKLHALTKQKGVTVWDIPTEFNEPSRASENHYPGEFDHISTAPTPSYPPTKSQYEPSPIHGMVAPVLTAPAALKPFVNSEGVKVKPSVNAFKKYGTPNHFIETKTITKVLTAEFEKLKQISYQPALDKVFSTHAAIYGDEKVEYLDAINASSSCGTIGRKSFEAEYGAQTGKINNNSYKLKADFETPDGKINKVLHKKVTEFENLMKKNKRPFIPWEDMPKDEPRPLEKVIAGKTRYFSSTSDIAFLVTFRKYFAGFNAAVMQAKIKNGYSVGTNVYGPDWDETQAEFTKFGENNCFAGDFAGFDSSHNYRVNCRVVNYINEYFYPKATKEENLIRQILWMEITESVHVHETDVYQWLKGQPSGNPMTTILNCIVNNVGMRLVWDSVWTEAGHTFMAEQHNFDKYVRHLSYGDDSLTCVHESAIGIFNQISVSKHFPRFGFEYTDESKGANGDIVPRKHYSEVTYLKRRFVRDSHYGHFIAPLEKKSIEKLTQWVKRNGETAESQIIERCEIAVREAALHNTEYFQQFRSKVETVLDEANLLSYARIPSCQRSIRNQIRSCGEQQLKMVDLSNL